VQFHRNGQLMLAAGLDKHIRFFQIDRKRTPQPQDPENIYWGLSSTQGLLMALSL
jgi:hypothetical protein